MKKNLRYGNNPHQQEAEFTAPERSLDILSGTPSYINLLDILTGWQITRDLWIATGEIAAASMKHCVPVGVALPGKLDAFTQDLLGIDSGSATLSAYLRARSSDWGAAYGDLAVVYGAVDAELAKILSRLVSDGIAATHFSADALDILKKKKGGQYLIVQLHRAYEPPRREIREVMGVELTQNRNNYIPELTDFEFVAGEQALVTQLVNELKLAAITMKYTVSNNIVLVSDGRTLAITAGQQSRVLSTKLACEKYIACQKFQHADVRAVLKQSQGKLTDRVLASAEAAQTTDLFVPPETPLVLGSDGYIPFRDNIEIAANHGVNVIFEPKGAMRGAEIEKAVADHGMTLVRTGFRAFYH
ncbi:MAG: hypothetical protein KDI36_03490 [Pseudomonadales bacterium]|nr:hypothetical protein [Pseudomonadales bacterium]